MTLPTLISKALSFLRIGYPPGIPATDTFAVLALLAERLSDEDVRRIAVAMARRGIFPVAATDIAVLIMKVTGQLPKPGDVQRVRKLMENHGWTTYDDCTRPNSN